MNKTWIGILLLAVILAGILTNSAILDKAVDEIRLPIMRAEELARNGKYEEAAHAAEAAVKLWDEHQSYFRCFMDHDESDSTAQLLAELKYALVNNSTISFEQIYETLNELSKTEKITLERIL